MTGWLRYLALAGTAIALLVAAMGTGHARGQAPVAGQIVLCVGTQVVTVSVDENGQPTTATQACPDGILKLSVPLVAPVVVSRPLVVARADLPLSVPLSAPSVPPMEVRARAPPMGL
jgi:hypothetical protein